MDGLRTGPVARVYRTPGRIHSAVARRGLLMQLLDRLLWTGTARKSFTEISTDLFWGVRTCIAIEVVSAKEREGRKERCK